MKALSTSTLSISVGPQHPGAGHFRLIITLDGDYIVDAVPDPGYVHRGAEKMCEYRNYFQNIPHLERPVIIDSIGITLPYCLAIENMLGIEAPPRAQYLRMIMAELFRITSHLYWLGIYGPFLGHTTMFMWPIGDREFFIDLGSLIGGQRITPAYVIPGGVRNDMPDGFAAKTLKVCDYFEKRLVEYDKIYFSNPLVLKRTEGVGVLRKADAVDLGMTGPNLRGSGVRSDTRKDDPYCRYDEIDFYVPSYEEGDSWARSMVRFEEMKQSMNIIRQALAKMPSGPVKMPMRGQVRLPASEGFARTEAARGVMAYQIVGQGEQNPYRVRISVPSFRSLPAFSFLLKGARLADMPAIYWSLDYWPVEADK